MPRPAKPASIAARTVATTIFRIGAEAVFEVAVDRKAADAREKSGMLDRVVTRHRVTSVLATERERESQRRAAQRRESGAREQRRRRAVPRVGHDEGLRALVQRAKTFVC